MNNDIGGVCIVTQPERKNTGKAHAQDLADIISQLTPVVLMTANLPSDSTLEENHEVVEYSLQGTGEHVLIEAVRFIVNQFRLCLALHKRKENIVLFFGTTSYVLPLLYARLLGKRVLVLPRGDVPLSLRLRWKESLPAVLARLLAGLVSLLEQISYHLTHGIISYTPAMAQQLGLERYRNKLYSDGARFVDIGQFNVQVPIEKRELTVGFIGRLDVEKRIPELIEAAKLLPDDIRFVFVGDGEYREQLETDLEVEIKNGKVDLTGWLDRKEVPRQLNQLRLLVVPSHPTEGLPTAILESMACGTPVLATPVSGVPDVVKEGKTGFLMDEIDGKTIAREIEESIKREDLEEISENGRELIEKEYSFRGAVERYERILYAIS